MNPRDPNTYMAVHQRLYRTRGKARNHRCVDCDGPAVEWSYDGTDPDERWGPTKAGRADSRPYSTKLSHYQPRCRSCHVLLDHGGSVTECANGHRWTPENTYVRPDNGNRMCRLCKSQRDRDRYQAAKVSS